MERKTAGSNVKNLARIVLSIRVYTMIEEAAQHLISKMQKVEVGEPS